MAKASAISYDVTTPIEVETVFKGKKAEALEEKYKTLFPEALLEKRRKAGAFDRRDIEADRRKMFKANDLIPLSISLTRYGYATFDPESYKMLNAAGLDAKDVKLFMSLGELNTTALEFYDILQKDQQRQTLSEEEKKVKETYQGLGVFDDESYDNFYNAQSSHY